MTSSVLYLRQVIMAVMEKRYYVTGYITGLSVDNQLPTGQSSRFRWPAGAEIKCHR